MVAAAVAKCLQTQRFLALGRAPGSCPRMHIDPLPPALLASRKRKVVAAVSKRTTRKTTKTLSRSVVAMEVVIAPFREVAVSGTCDKRLVFRLSVSGLVLACRMICPKQLRVVVLFFERLVRTSSFDSVTGAIRWVGGGMPVRKRRLPRHTAGRRAVEASVSGSGDSDCPWFLGVG